MSVINSYSSLLSLLVNYQTFFLKSGASNSPLLTSLTMLRLSTNTDPFGNKIAYSTTTPVLQPVKKTTLNAANQEPEQPGSTNSARVGVAQPAVTGKDKALKAPHAITLPSSNNTNAFKTAGTKPTLNTKTTNTTAVAKVDKVVTSTLKAPKAIRLDNKASATTAQKTDVAAPAEKTASNPIAGNEPIYCLCALCIGK